ncbi:MAG: glycosyltransferase family 2 protein [Nitrosopumilus sp.]|uniref:glycosyltransferase family 2 protein n=1 Tax=Nitrosopumilus sp. TaxID=2024843 RepID=UPI00247D74D5|nr:glycosyltransferase family 2 protein [Nitrosopumilus sp.]MCV0393508.1 glycosyltransferase family 2 protein [Nitrosopumilus sp.]
MNKISIIIPVFNEPSLPKTIQRLLNLKNKISQYEFELIFVDDGSKDNSLKYLLEFREKFPEIIKVVKLSRNFGGHSAIRAGLKISEGNCVGVISADLQDPPELFLDMIKYWEKGSKIVLAVRKERHDSITSKITANIYYNLLKKYAIPNFPKGGFDFYLIDRQVVNELNRLPEKNTTTMNLLVWLGFDYVTIPYVREKREEGNSGWSLSKKIKLVIDSFIAFSYLPIKLLPILGGIFAIGSFVYGGIVFYNWFIGKTPIEGWTSTIILVTFIGGIQMIMLGILGEYLWRTLDEIRTRPTFVIDKIFDNKKNN